MERRYGIYMLIIAALIASMLALASAADILAYSSSSKAAEKSGAGKQSSSQKVSADRKCPCITCVPTSGTATKWGSCVCRIQKRLSTCSNYCRNGKLTYIRNCIWK